jgi:uncharacterized membrane protein
MGRNDAIAAAITRWVGSMWAVYVSTTIILAWMALGKWGPLQAVDPYPYRVMLLIGNLVQVLLCFVILVGQGVLSRAADQRAEQTYRNAEAIFGQVAELQRHLDRHDELLNRGLSLLESRPHWWIEAHRIQEPPRAKDQAVSLNGRIAAWLTERMGTMWACYVAAVFQFGWIGLSLAGVLTFDPPPYFAFLAFLENLGQFLIMFIIMVGQDVLGRAAVKRAEQTSLDAEAILHECRRMEARLTAHDRVIESLGFYLRKNFAGHIAPAIHEAYVERCVANGEPRGSREALQPWDELSELLKESNRDQALAFAEKLAAIGCVIVPADEPPSLFSYKAGEVLRLARMEHDRWMRERERQGYVRGAVRVGLFHPDLVPWDELSPGAREKDIQAVRDIPRILAAAGYQVIRVAEPTSEAS